jgi:hypothetical protein
MTPRPSHVCAPQCARKQRRIEELGVDTLRLQQLLQKTQQELKDTQSCHAVQVAQLGDQHSTLLESHTELQRTHNKMSKNLEETKVRHSVPAASCCCCYSGCTALAAVVPVMLLLLL